MRAALRLSSTAAATRSAASLRMYHGMAIPQPIMMERTSPSPSISPDAVEFVESIVKSNMSRMPLIFDSETDSSSSSSSSSNTGIKDVYASIQSTQLEATTAMAWQSAQARQFSQLLEVGESLKAVVTLRHQQVKVVKMMNMDEGRVQEKTNNAVYLADGVKEIQGLLGIDGEDDMTSKIQLELDSVMRKRRKMMKKHRRKKRRKLERYRTRKNTK